MDAEREDGDGAMSEHYFTNQPVSESCVREIVYALPEGELRLLTDRGVFSGSRVDHGSDILIRAVRAMEKGPKSLLDIGCGYGPIAIALGKAWPDSRLMMIDVNQRAMELARENAGRNGVSAVVKEASNLPDEFFEVVVTNPPIRAGKDVVYGIFRQAWDHLPDGGRLYVVIRKNQGAESAVRELQQLFGNCETVERQSGFHILRSRKTKA